MFYNWVKVFHVFGATVLFGTGLSTVAYTIFIHRTKNIALIAKATKNVVYADWVFTGTAGVFQPITGMMMVMAKGYSILTFWVLFAIIGYFLSAIFWLPVVAIQKKLCHLSGVAEKENIDLPSRYYTYFKAWMVFASLAFLTLVGVFFVMANRPESVSEFQHMI